MPENKNEGESTIDEVRLDLNQPAIIAAMDHMSGAVLLDEATSILA